MIEGIETVPETHRGFVERLAERRGWKRIEWEDVRHYKELDEADHEWLWVWSPSVWVVGRVRPWFHWEDLGNSTLRRSSYGRDKWSGSWVLVMEADQQPFVVPEA